MAAAVQDDGLSDIGLFGLAVMGKNFGFNIADHGFNISLCNRSRKKVLTAVEEARGQNLKGRVKFFSVDGPDGAGDDEKKCGSEVEVGLAKFVESIRKPRSIIILVKAGNPVRDTINSLVPLLEDGDLIIDGGNEWYENTEMRADALIENVGKTPDEIAKIEKEGKPVNTSEIANPKKTIINYMGMGVSGGEDGARYGPSLMPGGPVECYERIQPILEACAAKATDGTVCVTHIGRGGAGNYVKMIHNGIEYGDMQLIAEAYDLLKLAGGLSNDQLCQVFQDWNKTELNSFLIEITAQIFATKDDLGPDRNAYLVDMVLDKTGSKGTGMWTVKEAAQQGIAAPTISAALNARYLSSLKDERIDASKIFTGPDNSNANTDLSDKAQLDAFIEDVKAALYASKIMSYTQGMNLIRQAGEENDWKLNLGKIASIWKAGCIIRAQFLDRITAAYDKNAKLKSLLFDDDFAKEVQDREAAWRRVVGRAVAQGIPVPAMAGSLSYYDSYRRERLPANLTQSQRDLFGRHTFQRIDDAAGVDENGKKFVSATWAKL